VGEVGSIVLILDGPATEQKINIGTGVNKVFYLALAQQLVF
jgi:hypothetical protein